MSIVKPFKAVRPAKEYAALVAAPPYDVMNSDEAREMVKDNPHSFLHVDKAEIDLDKSINIYDSAVYAKAKENLTNLINDKILIADEKPCFYIYRLTMNGHSQTGLVACTSVDEYLSGKIKKHEMTRADKEADRINHILATNANTGPIFLACKSKPSINTFLQSFTDSVAPVYSFTAGDGITHEVWVVDEDTAIADITALFDGVESLYIADGHHRNESAAKVAQKKRAEKDDPQAEFNYYLSVIFPHDQLLIMDYNRVVRTLNGLTADQFLEKIQTSFDVTEIGGSAYKPESRHTFGMYLSKTWYKLTAKPEITDDTDTIKSLDVSILSDNILTPILGIGDIRLDKNIDFVGGMRGLSELEKRVDSGEMAVAFAMYPTSMDELMSVADANKIMPPKSTWFEPKLRSGLFIHFLD